MRDEIRAFNGKKMTWGIFVVLETRWKKINGELRASDPFSAVQGVEFSNEVYETNVYLQLVMFFR